MFQLIIFFISIQTFSQTTWTNFNTDNSPIPYNQVNSLEFGNSQNSSNNIFIGTSYGLSILELDNFNLPNNSWISIYETDIKDGLIGNEIINIQKDINDKMWICTTEGISILDFEYSQGEIISEQWSYINSNNSEIQSDMVKSILFEENNKTWIGSTGGLTIKENENWETFSFENQGIYSNNIKKIIKNYLTNEIYIGTLNGGFQLYNNNTFESYNNTNSGLIDNTINDFIFDNNNNLIITSPYGGLEVLTNSGNWLTLNTGTYPNLPFFINSLNNVIVDNNNNLWISTVENGLIQYSNDNWIFYNEENSGLSDNKINCLKYDSLYNRLWIGTETKGLTILDLNFISNSLTNQKITEFKPHFSNNNLILNNSEIGVCRIYNRIGKLIHIEKITKKNTTIYLQNLYPEIYIIQFETIDEIFTKGLIFST
tara:strand:+ start:195 stop:1478 length:1284 start_codon:yes stop_codon:yes gene_type:complete